MGPCTYPPRSPRSRDDDLAAFHLQEFFPLHKRTESRLNNDHQMVEPIPSEFLQFEDGAGTSHEDATCAQNKFGRRQWQSAYNCCDAFDEIALFVEWPRVIVQEFVTIEEIDVGQVMTVAHSPNVHQWHQTQVTYLMLNQW